MNWVKGQRCISETEPEMGLGIVQETDVRRVTVFFPVADEQRTYAVSSAPLSRVHFADGEQISFGEDTAVVTAVIEEEGLLCYVTEKGEVPESELSSLSQFNRPEQRLLKNQADSLEDYDLRQEALEHSLALARSPTRGFMGARVELIPHQFHIAQEACRRMHPRILLSDEVGLGKTIEACLIMHRLLCTGQAKRVLILVPEALINQWFVECYRRFNLSFRIASAELWESWDGQEELFENDALVLGSLDHLAEDPARAALILSDECDLLIMDEAHHLHWSEKESGLDYKIAEALCKQTPSVLLLTATPEQLGRESHFARLRLLDPERYHSLDAFFEEEEDYEIISEKAEALLAEGDTSALAELLDLQGPGRVVFRNTRKVIQGFPKRKPHLVELKEDKLKWLAGFVKKDPLRKILLICSAKDEAMRIHDELCLLINVNTGLFHEELSLLQRDRNAAWFSQEEGAQLLICSEIGGEGRNFQFSHDLVLWDLPRNPEHIEQRIGRLDRIGQRSTIHVWIPVMAGTEEAFVAQWLCDGVDIFSGPLIGSVETYEPFIAKLDEQNPKLIKETKRYRTKLEKKMELGRDRLLELQSNRPEQVEALLTEIKTYDGRFVLENFALKIFDRFGIMYECIDARCYVLKPGALLTDAIPAFPLEGAIVTFDRKEALSREEIIFLTWDHPMITQALDWILSSEVGVTSVATAKGPAGILLELNYVLDSMGKKELALARYFPARPLTLCINQELEVVELSAESLTDAKQLAPFQADAEIMQSVLAQLGAAEGQITQELETRVEEAKARAKEILGLELKRLVELKKSNVYIDSASIKTARDHLQQCLTEISQSTARLDSLRIILSR